MRLLLPIIATAINLTNNPFYLRCNDIQAQNDYIQQERTAFAIDENRSAFSANYVYDEPPAYFPSACRDSYDQYYKPVETYGQFVLNNTILPLSPSTDRITYFDNAIYNFIDWFWTFTSWESMIVDGEHYMYYENPNTDKVVFYFHGINALNGLENLWLMRDLTNQASVYMMRWTPIFMANTDNGYNFTFNERIAHVNRFVLDRAIQRGAPFTLIGNSFGTVQITVMCKQFPDTCAPASKIVLTDPILLNTPFSRIHDAAISVFSDHEEYNDMFGGGVNVVKVLRQSKFYNMLLLMFEWYEWSIDSHFIRWYEDKLILVIGNRDNTLDVRSSPILNRCHVIHTDTRHGMVIFDGFLKSVDLWSTSCKIELEQ